MLYCVVKLLNDFGIVWELPALVCKMIFEFVVIHFLELISEAMQL